MIVSPALFYFAVFWTPVMQLINKFMMYIFFADIELVEVPLSPSVNTLKLDVCVRTLEGDSLLFLTY